MEIAIINSHAMQKSTGKLSYNLMKHLKKNNHNVKLYCSRVLLGDNLTEDMTCVCSNFERYIYALWDRLFGNEGLNAFSSTVKLIYLLKKQSPEVVYLMNLHAYYINQPMLFKYLSSRNIKVIYVMFDEYAFTGKCCFAFDCDKFEKDCGACCQISEYPRSFFFDKSTKLQVMKKNNYALLKDITFVGVEYTVSRAKKSSIMPINAKFVVADEGVDIKHLYYPRDAKTLKSKLKIDNDKIVILTVAPYPNMRKGGKYFIESAKILENDKHFVFVHVGFSGNVQACPTNYIPVSYVENQDVLAEFYSMADLFVCTSLAETIPDTCIEALACGTPILGFNISGIPTCADELHGKFVEPRNSLALVSEIKKTEKKTANIIESCRKYAQSRFDADDYSRKLEAIIYDE